MNTPVGGISKGAQKPRRWNVQYTLFIDGVLQSDEQHLHQKRQHERSCDVGHRSLTLDPNQSQMNGCEIAPHVDQRLEPPQWIPLQEGGKSVVHGISEIQVPIRWQLDSSPKIAHRRSDEQQDRSQNNEVPPAIRLETIKNWCDESCNCIQRFSLRRHGREEKHRPQEE